MLSMSDAKTLWIARRRKITVIPNVQNYWSRTLLLPVRKEVQGQQHHIQAATSGRQPLLQ